MKIITPNDILEGENIEAILKQYGNDCLRGADLWGANLWGADLSGANHVKLSIAKTSILPDEGDIIG